MEQLNPDFPQTDVVLVLRANDLEGTRMLFGDAQKSVDALVAEVRR